MQHAGGVLLARAGPSETFIKSIPVSGKIIYRMIRAEANQSNTVRVSIDNRGKDKLQFIDAFKSAQPGLNYRVIARRRSRRGNLLVSQLLSNMLQKILYFGLYHGHDGFQNCYSVPGDCHVAALLGRLLAMTVVVVTRSHRLSPPGKLQFIDLYERNPGKEWPFLGDFYISYLIAQRKCSG